MVWCVTRTPRGAIAEKLETHIGLVKEENGSSPNQTNPIPGFF